MLLRTNKTEITHREMEMGEISLYRGKGDRPFTRKSKKSKIHKQKYKDNRHCTGES
jgi:hypothetical protein